LTQVRAPRCARPLADSEKRSAPAPSLSSVYSRNFTSGIAIASFALWRWPMSRQNFAICACVFVMILGTGAPQAVAQVEVTPPPTQQVAPVVVQAPAPTIVNNNAPASDTLTDRSRVGLRLLGSGAVLFGVTYGITVITAAAVTDICNADSTLGCRDAKWPLYIPVAGPFIQMGYVSGNGSNTAKALLGIDGVLQGAGLTMMIAGAVLTAQGRSRPARYSVAPYAGGGSVGLVSVGRF
jgi:hypothetical protein